MSGPWSESEARPSCYTCGRNISVGWTCDCDGTGMPRPVQYTPETVAQFSQWQQEIRELTARQQEIRARMPQVEPSIVIGSSRAGGAEALRIGGSRAILPTRDAPGFLRS